jgi:hypothetical protein
MNIHALALSMAFAASVASLAAAAAARPIARGHLRKHAPPAAVTVRPDPSGGWGGPEWYKGWGGWGWGYGAGQGLLAGALIGGGLTAPYYDFTFGYPTHRPPYGYRYVAFPYGAGYPYYNISYGYYRPPSPR